MAPPSRFRSVVVGGLAAVPLAVLLGGCAQETIRTIQKSMEPTIRSGELVQVDHEAFAHADPAIGQIVSAESPAGALHGRCGMPRRVGQPCSRAPRGTEDVLLVKRVVAVGGDRVAIAADGTLIRNGRRAPEPYITPCRGVPTCALPRPIVVPPGHFFLLGDNRPYSADSRIFGPVPRADLDGAIRLGPPGEG